MSEYLDGVPSLPDLMRGKRATAKKRRNALETIKRQIRQRRREWEQRHPEAAPIIPETPYGFVEVPRG